MCTCALAPTVILTKYVSSTWLKAQDIGRISLPPSQDKKRGDAAKKGDGGACRKTFEGGVVRDAEDERTLDTVNNRIEWLCEAGIMIVSVCENVEQCTHVVV